MKFLDPSIIIEHLDLSPGHHVAELFSGSGFLTIPIAREVGHYGRVYALHDDKSALERILGEAKAQDIGNIHARKGNMFLGIRDLVPELVSRIVVAHPLSVSSGAYDILSSAYAMLDKEGRMILVEPRKENPLIPSSFPILSPEEAIAIGQMCGFTNERHFHAGDFHYGIVFKKI